MKPLGAPVLLVLLSLVLLGCESPTEPKQGIAELSIRCMPEESNVRCVSTAYNVGGIASRDVTASTTWTASPAIGSWAQPGLFVPSGRGEVAISARFETVQAPYPRNFLVGPGEPARTILYIGGFVKDAATNAVIQGATVRIESGYAAGKSTVTNERGAYMIEPIVTGETFTITASKEGYQTLTRTYRVDDGNGNSPLLDLLLSR